MNEFSITPFATDNKKEPFTDWILNLDKVTRKRIFLRLAKIRVGNFGDYKYIEAGIFELRFFFGGGYRIYFGKDEKTKTLVILLCGGSKNTQSKDIKRAKLYWRKYNEQKNQES